MKATLSKRVLILSSVLLFAQFTACNNLDSVSKNASEVSDEGAESDAPRSSGVLTGSAALDDEEWAFITLINDYRAQNGAPKLQISISLTRASDWASVDMATKNYFSHTDSDGGSPFTRMAEWGYPSNSSRAENIACGNSTAEATFTQWKNSSGHNANMLNPSYQVIGIGRAYSAGSNFRWYWTTDFGSVVDGTVR